MKTGRRTALVLVSLLGLLPRFALARRKVIEAAGTSAYWAPQLACQLIPGTRLSIMRRRGTAYLAFGPYIVGRLPIGTTPSSARVSSLRQGDDGRTRLFVELA